MGEPYRMSTNLMYKAEITSKTIFGVTVWIVTVTIGNRVIRKAFASEAAAKAFVDALGQIIDDIIVNILPA